MPKDNYILSEKIAAAAMNDGLMRPRSFYGLGCVPQQDDEGHSVEHVWSHMTGEKTPLIAHIIFRLHVGGLENGLVNLINHMPGRYRHVIICLRDYTDFRCRLQRDDVQIFALHKREGKDPGLYLRLWSLLRRVQPEIVHTRNLGTVDALIPAALAGVKHRIHSEHGWDMNDLYGRRLKYKMLRRTCAFLTEHYIALSSDLESWLNHQVGISERKLSHIYNGVDMNKFMLPDHGRSELPVHGFAPPGTVVLGHVGRMDRVKDQLTLVQAFIHLLDHYPGARQVLRLVMIGDGPLRAEAQAMLEQSNAVSLAWLPGERDDIADILHGIDVFILPSLNEGISNTILEAMASGLPVVATDVGGNSELVQDGVTGLLVPPSDPVAMASGLEKYLDNHEMMKLHGLAGRKRVEREFSIEAMVNRYTALYDQVMRTRQTNQHVDG